MGMLVAPKVLLLRWFGRSGSERKDLRRSWLHQRCGPKGAVRVARVCLCLRQRWREARLRTVLRRRVVQPAVGPMRLAKRKPLVLGEGQEALVRPALLAQGVRGCRRLQLRRARAIMPRVR